MPDGSGLIDTFRNLFGGGGLAMIGAVAGRLMWHVSEYRKRRRKLLSVDLLWELPIAVGMGFIAEGISSYFQFNNEVTVGLIVGLSYLGPRGIEAIFEKWMSWKTGLK